MIIVGGAWCWTYSILAMRSDALAAGDLGAQLDATALERSPRSGRRRAVPRADRAAASRPRASCGFVGAPLAFTVGAPPVVVRLKGRSQQRLVAKLRSLHVDAVARQVHLTWAFRHRYQVARPPSWIVVAEER